MNLQVKRILFCLVVGKLGIYSAYSQMQVDWKEVGQLKTRRAKEILASTWSIGGEVLDRDFTDYHAYKSYLGPLGAKRIRLQAGWQHEQRPEEKYDPKSTTITTENARFDQPVLIDLITGKIYGIPKAQWTKSGSKYTFTGIPVPDYPVVISDIANL